MKNRIREARNKAGLTQKELSEITGISKRSIEEWEAQRVEPSAYKLYNIAQVLKCSIEDLLVIDDEEKPE